MNATPVGPLSGPGTPGDLANPVCPGQWPTLYPVDETPEERELRVISARRKRRAEADADDLAAQRSAIVAALDAGVKQVRIVAITGFTREYIRRIALEERAAAHAESPAVADQQEQPR